MVNKYSILNEEKYFYYGTLPNFFGLIPAKNALNVLVSLLEYFRGNILEYQEKVLKI